MQTNKLVFGEALPSEGLTRNFCRFSSLPRENGLLDQAVAGGSSQAGFAGFQMSGYRASLSNLSPTFKVLKY